MFDTDVNEGVEDQGEDTPLDKTETETTEEAKAEPDADSQDNDDADTEGEDKPEGDEPDGETEPEKKPSRASDRIRELSAKAKAAEAENEQLRQQLQQRDDPQQKQDKPQSADGAPVKPNVEDFDIESEGGLDAYFDAQAKYDKELKTFEFDQYLQQREQAKQQEAESKELLANFELRYATNPKFKEDFRQLATLMQDKPIQADPSQLYAGDDLIDIIEHIAADSDLYYEIADMSEQRQYAEFGKLHAQIQSRKSAPKTARQSKAPPPPNHTKANAPAKRNPYSGSDDEFMEARGL